MSKRYDAALEFLERTETWLDREFGPEDPEVNSFGRYVGDVAKRKAAEAKGHRELGALLYAHGGIQNLFRVFPLA